MYFHLNFLSVLLIFSLLNEFVLFLLKKLPPDDENFVFPEEDLSFDKEVVVEKEEEDPLLTKIV
jgi:hypothetical protein